MALRLLLAWVAIAGLTAAGAANAHAKNIAILVGVEKYADADHIGPLNYCIEDVDALSETLVKLCGYDRAMVLVMHDGFHYTEKHKWPLRANIEKNLRRMLSQAEPDDTVLFFFSGHGFLRDGEGILATGDTEYNRLGQTGLKTTDLKNWLDDCAARRKFLILDCCHAAAANGKKDAVQLETNSLGNQFGAADTEALKRKNFEVRYDVAKGTVTLASCASEQKSQEWEDEQRGLFTYYLLEGLKGAADRDDDQVVSHLELYQYTYAMVSNLAFNRFGVEQTPVLYLEPNTTGVFPLARLKGRPAIPGSSRPPVEQPLAAELKSSPIPPPPGLEADLAFNRIKVGKSAASELLKDAELLVSEAERLRKSPANAANAITPDAILGNPFFHKERAAKIHEWLLEARKVYSAQPEAATPLSMDVSLALAAWHGESRDPAIAAEAISRLAAHYPFDKEELAPLSGPLLLVHANTRSADAAGRRQAIESFSRVVKLMTEAEKTTRLRPSNPLDYQTTVLAPARDIAEKVIPTDATLRSQVAEIYQAFGDLIDNNRTTNEEELANALTLFRKAAELEPSLPQPRIGLASVMLRQRDRNFAAALAEAKAGLERTGPNDTLDRARAHRIAADALLLASRDEPAGAMDTRLQKLGESLTHYNASIDEFKRLPAVPLDSRTTTMFASTHLSRSAADLEFANLAVWHKAFRAERLEQATEDARQAAKLDETLGYQAFVALGNAYEDLNWLAGKKGAYDEAERAFRGAVEVGRNKPEAFINLGRCLYKAGRPRDAAVQLEHSLLLGEQPEALYWLARIAIDDKDFEQADLRLQQLNNMLNSSTKDLQPQDVLSYRRAFIELPLKHAEHLINQGEALKSEGRTRVFKELGNAKFRAPLLGEDDPAGAILVTAMAIENESKTYRVAMLNPALDKAAAKEIGEQLETNQAAALELYRKALANPSIKGPERLSILCRHMECMLDHKNIWTADFSKANPELLELASQAEKLSSQVIEQIRAEETEGFASVMPVLAQDDKERSELAAEFKRSLAQRLEGMVAKQRRVRGLSAMTHANYASYLLSEGKHLNLANEHLGYARRLYREALPESHQSPARESYEWKFAYGLAILLHRDANLLRTKPDSQAQFAQARKEGCEWYAFAKNNCPKAEESVIYGAWTKLYRLSQ